MYNEGSTAERSHAVSIKADSKYNFVTGLVAVGHKEVLIVIRKGIAPFINHFCSIYKRICIAVRSGINLSIEIEFSQERPDRTLIRPPVVVAARGRELPLYCQELTLNIVKQFLRSGRFRHIRSDRICFCNERNIPSIQIKCMQIAECPQKPGFRQIYLNGCFLPALSLADKFVSKGDLVVEAAIHRPDKIVGRTPRYGVELRKSGIIPCYHSLVGRKDLMDPILTNIT